MGISPHRYTSLLSPCRTAAFINSHLLGDVAQMKLLVPYIRGVTSSKLPCELKVLPPDALCPSCKNSKLSLHMVLECFAHKEEMAAAVMLHVSKQQLPKQELSKQQAIKAAFLAYHKAVVLVGLMSAGAAIRS